MCLLHRRAPGALLHRRREVPGALLHRRGLPRGWSLFRRKGRTSRIVPSSTGGLTSPTVRRHTVFAGNTIVRFEIRFCKPIDTNCNQRRCDFVAHRSDGTLIRFHPSQKHDATPVFAPPEDIEIGGSSNFYNRPVLGHQPTLPATSQGHEWACPPIPAVRCSFCIGGSGHRHHCHNEHRRRRGEILPGQEAGEIPAEA